MLDVISGILVQHGQNPTRLVQILRDVMAASGELTPKTITAIAKGLGLPRARVEGVACFYSFFVTEPRGRYRVLFSDNITDRMQGSVALRQRLLDAFDLKLGEVSRGGLVSVGTTSCTGLCDQGPALLVNGRAIARLTPARIGAISSLIRGGSPVEDWPDNLFTVDVHLQRGDLLLATPFMPGDMLKAAVGRGPQGCIDAVRQANLRGRGGAGFTTGQKWQACRDAPGEAHYIVCNADEGEPGTYKDRVLLSDYADQVFEGMTVAGYAVGAREGFLYLRGEYAFLQDHLQAMLTRRRRDHLLGSSILGIPGFDFDIQIHWGAGAYVCGEESALIESMEGKRGIPRNRPPYPVTCGYLNQPTVVNNVETLVAAGFIVGQGPEWFTAKGTPRSSGTRVQSVSGDVARPGIYEYPWGVTVRQVLEDAGAQVERIQAVQVGGPSGTLLGPGEFGRRIAFEDVPSAGAFMVFDDTRDMVEVIDNFAHFFAHESCGFCTPCRVGTTLIAQMTHHLVIGKGTRRDIKDLSKVSLVMKAASHCGLGATAGNPILQGLQKFRPSFDGKLASTEVLPSFDLDEALAAAREATGREDDEAHFFGEYHADAAHAGPKAEVP
jgi:[NiFe] hydrogenase diaphorase moiety large subunit